MKKSIRNLLFCGALVSTLTLTSCNFGDDIKSIELVSSVTTIYEDTNFDYSNLKIKITKEDGTIENIEVTDEMIISKPDFSTTGEKEIKVKYNDVEYVIAITVIDNVVADNYYTKLQSYLTQITNGTKNASSIKLSVNGNATGRYFNSVVSWGDEGVENPFENKNISFTKEQVNNDAMLKALGQLGLSIERGDIVTTGNEVYASLATEEFMQGLMSIIMDNQAYFDALTTSYTNMAILSACVPVMASNIELYFGREPGTTQVTPLLTEIMNDALMGQVNRESVNALILEMTSFMQLDASTVSNALISIEQNGNYFESVVDVLYENGIINIYDYENGELNEELTLEVYEKISNYAIQLDNLVAGKEHSVVSAYVDVMVSATTAYYSASIDGSTSGGTSGSGQDSTPSEEDEEATAVLNAFKELATEIDKILNGKDNVAVEKVVALVEKIDVLVNKNYETMSEELLAVYGLYAQYIKPELTVNKINNYLATLNDVPNMTSEQLVNGFMQSLVAFLQNEDTKAMVSSYVDLMVVNVLSQYATDSYAIYTEGGELQPYVVSISSKIVDFIYNQNIGFATLVDEIDTIYTSNNLSQNFAQGLKVLIDGVDAIVNMVNETTLSSEDFAICYNFVVTAFGIDTELDSSAESKVNSFITNVRLACLSNENSDNEKLMVFINETNQLIQSTESDFKDDNAILVDLIDGVLTSYSTNGNFEFYKNYVNATLNNTYNDFTNNEKAILLEIASIYDNIDTLTQEQLYMEIVQLISMPDFTSFMAKAYDIDEDAVTLLRVFMYVVLDVPNVNYNVLMADIDLPTEWVSVDFNQLIASLKVMNLNNMFKVSDIKITTEEAVGGAIASQKATVVVEFDFNAGIGEINADFTFDIELTY
ncbi:MAG: hypothetical protein IJZ29_01345 [Clostridia bacterium]|nr:hypothetical protein [Clostridia bacterium]